MTLQNILTLNIIAFAIKLMKRYLWAGICSILLFLTACGSTPSEKKPAAEVTDTAPEEISKTSNGDTSASNIPQPKAPQPQVPKVNIPKPNIPQPKIPKINIPQPRFPKPNFPVIELPEIQLPDIQVQQGEEATIYTLPSDILFDFDKATLRPDAEAALEQIQASIQQRFPDAPLEITGHTDSKGDERYNLQLSQQRADSVKQWLEAKGFSLNRLQTKGLGESQPVAPNTNPDQSDNPDGRQQNRRVEIIVETNQE